MASIPSIEPEAREPQGASRRFLLRNLLHSLVCLLVLLALFVPFSPGNVQPVNSAQPRMAVFEGFFIYG